MTRYESKPRAALIAILPSLEAMTVGSQRDSLESMRRKTASCDLMSSCKRFTSDSVEAIDAEGMG